MRSGFTLVELMLATLILAIMMAIIYGIVVSTIHAEERIEEITMSSEIGPAILSQIRRDLEAAFLPDPKEEGFVALDKKSSSGDRDRIDFVTGTPAYGSEVEGDPPIFHGVNEVGYQLADSRSDPSVGILYRREDHSVDGEPLRGGRIVEIYHRVKHFSMDFWDGEKWGHEWNSKQAGGKLPVAVRVELKLLTSERGNLQAEQSFVTTVTFPK